MINQVATPGERIKQALTEANMKQAELARRADLNTGALAAWIKGRYEPKQMAIYRMAKALNVSEMWLIGCDVPKERPPEQKENDAIADIVQRLRQDPDFRSLVWKEKDLNPEQLKLLEQLVNQMAARPE